MFDLKSLLSTHDPATGEIAGVRTVKRHLSDLEDCFVDRAAYTALLAKGDPLVYSVASVEPASGDGDLHYGIGRLLPGKVGDEYFMTKGHLHAWRPAAEFYFGLTGEGMMLLQEESTGESRIVPLQPNNVVYVPGCTAHRTINIGKAPLAYIGVYPAKAGHDYRTIVRKNFRCVVVERDGKPAMIERKEFLK